VNPPQYASKFNAANQRFSASGKNDVTTFGSYTGGNDTLVFMFTLFQNNDMVLDLVKRELGEEGVERDAAGPATAARMPRTGKRAVAGPQSDLLHAIVENSASMVRAVEKQSTSTELAALSQTLKNLKEAGAPVDMVEKVQSQMWDALRSTKLRRADGTAAAAEASGAGESRPKDAANVRDTSDSDEDEG